MIYKIIGRSNYSEVNDWIIQLDNPLVSLTSAYTNILGSRTHVTASGLGETMLLLKYGHILDCITKYKTSNVHLLEVWEWVDAHNSTSIAVKYVGDSLLITTKGTASQALIAKFGHILEQVL